MKILFAIAIVLCCFTVAAQNDIDVLLMKNGERIECTILRVQSDSIHISRFSGRHQVFNAYPLDEVAVYLVNNFYPTPAEDIIRASGHFYTGTSIMVAGGIITALAINDDKNELALIGSGVSLLGTIFLYSGFSKLNQAGRKMNKFQLQNDRIIYRL